jgi:hypothetical protein
MMEVVVEAIDESNGTQLRLHPLSASYRKMSTFGTLFRVTTYGESHCASVGCIVDGCPPVRLTFFCGHFYRRLIWFVRIASFQGTRVVAGRYPDAAVSAETRTEQLDYSCE